MDACRRTWKIWLIAGLFLFPPQIQCALAQETARQVIDVRLEHHRVASPKGPIRITEGDVVELRWTSDAPVELHIHGYDLKIRVRPGTPATTFLKARLTGRFPITRHGRGDGGHGHHALTYLEVYPN